MALYRLVFSSAFDISPNVNWILDSDVADGDLYVSSFLNYVIVSINQSINQSSLMINFAAKVAEE